MSCETPIKSLSEFIDQLAKKCGAGQYIFRGQPEQKHLIPRIARGVVDFETLRDIEEKMFNDFKRSMMPLGDTTPENWLEYLALAQHHEMKTRLLDWTSNALAALWYGVRKEQGQYGKDAVVWILKTERNDFLDERDPQMQSKDQQFHSISGTRLYRPRLINKRIAAQGGLFSVHELTPETKFGLDGDKKFRPRLQTISVASGECQAIRDELNQCGVNEVSLFPDYSGLCKHLTWFYLEKHSGLYAHKQPSGASTSTVTDK